MENNKKYKKIDYEALKLKVDLLEHEGRLGLTRVKKLQHVTHLRKEKSLIDQQKMICLNEFKRLMLLKKDLEAKLDNFINENVSNNDITYIQGLQLDLQKNRKALYNHLKIMNSINNNEEFKKILLDLESEFDISSLKDQNMVDKSVIVTGIPEEAFNLQCPNTNLKITVLEQFIYIDGYYVEKLGELENAENLTFHFQNYGNWSQDDHDTFTHLKNVYSRNTKGNNRLLFIDMLQRLLPNKNRQEIVEHERWYCDMLFKQCKYEQIIHNWNADRDELLNKCSLIFQKEANRVLSNKIKKEQMQRQKNKTEAIYEKLKEWGAMKMERMQLQMNRMDELHKQIQEDNIIEDAIKKEKEIEIKEKVQQFHDKLNEMEKEKRLKEEERLKELEKVLKKQALYDAERIKFRRQQLQEKKQKILEKETENKKQLDVKNEILEAIRKKVRPQVKCDLMRLWQNTTTWSNKQKKNNENNAALFYNLNTFSTEQITADPRFRLEERLRKAGLMHSEYARSVLANTNPTHQPRKDVLSNVQFQNC